MDKCMEDHRKLDLKWILLVFMSPIAFLLLILLALLSLLRFFLKAMLLFIIVAINTPFAVMINSSILVQNFWNSSFDPRVIVGIELKTIVSDFFKVIVAEFLLVMSTGVITFYTAPIKVFYISMVGGVTAIGLKWLNINSLSKTAFSCLCDGFGLNPMMFFFSFIGFFDIGCHPVAKCSFVAHKSFLFVKDGVLPEEDLDEDVLIEVDLKESNLEQGHSKLNEEGGQKIVQGGPFNRLFKREDRIKEVDIEQGDKELENKEVAQNILTYIPFIKERDYPIKVDREQGDKKLKNEANWTQFDGAVINRKELLEIKFLKWNAFERGLFQLCPRIDFIKTIHGKYILKSFMVLKLRGVNLCEYHVERLELPEDYSKAKELYHFLVTLSEKDGFVTDKMRGRYEHSLTLLQIVEGVEENVGYKIVNSIDKRFVVAGCPDLE